MSKVIENREQLFFEIALLLASCKTPKEQQEWLAKILRKTETAKSRHQPHQSSISEEKEVQKQLVRYYQIGFVRWGLLQQGRLITNDFVKIEGRLVWYSEKSKHHESFHIPHNLMDAFNDGWNAMKKMAEKAA